MPPKRSAAEVAEAKAEKEAKRAAKQEAQSRRKEAALVEKAKREEQRQMRDQVKVAKAHAKLLAGPKAKAKAKALTMASGMAKPKLLRPFKRSLPHKVSGEGEGAPPRKRQRRICSEAAELENDGGGSVAPEKLECLECLASSAVARDRAGFIATETGLQRKHVAGAIQLFDEGCTLPFIARYRKEKTGSMDETSLRRVERSLRRVEALEHRRRTIASALLALGKLDEALNPLLASTTLEELEDLYEPYKVKRLTRAQMARDKGLAPLAELIEKVGGSKSWQDASQVALLFCSQAKGVDTAEVALQGARDILAERYSRKAAFKNHARTMLKAGAGFMAKRKGLEVDRDRKYEHYWNFHVPLRKLWNHQFLAVQRGEREKILSVSFTCATGVEEQVVGEHVPWKGSETWLNELWAAATDGLKRLLRPTIEREWRRALKESAEDEAYDTYRRNLKAKLLSPPLFKQRAPGCIVGLDPGYTHGCKLAVVAPTGGVIETDTIYPVPRQGGQPQHSQHVAEQTLSSILIRLQPAAIAIGNGTASAETEDFVRRILQTTKLETGYTIVDESGASIYSASLLASGELPSLDVSIRGAVSIARRALDPLAELVKIDPQSIGVGLYQHDVDQKRLKLELHGVVEDCVNAVGVDVNTASPALLQYIAGIGAKLSEALVAHRDSNGAFKCREDLHKVKGLGASAFEQSAGFLRIVHGAQPLDETAIHPESYSKACRLQNKFGSKCERLDVARAGILEDLAQELDCGAETLRDIVSQLQGLEEDPRALQPQPLMKHVHGSKKRKKSSQDGDGIDAQEMGIGVDQLKPGMHLEGVVRNVVAFGAFVDIGVHHEGLLHFTKYPKPLPRPVWPSVNDRIVVTVEAPPEQRGKRWRISLSMRQGDAGG